MSNFQVINTVEGGNSKEVTDVLERKIHLIQVSMAAYTPRTEPSHSMLWMVLSWYMKIQAL